MNQRNIFIFLIFFSVGFCKNLKAETYESFRTATLVQVKQYILQGPCGHFQNLQHLLTDPPAPNQETVTIDEKELTCILYHAQELFEKKQSLFSSMYALRAKNKEIDQLLTLIDQGTNILYTDNRSKGAFVRWLQTVQKLPSVVKEHAALTYVIAIYDEYLSLHRKLCLYTGILSPTCQQECRPKGQIPADGYECKSPIAWQKEEKKDMVLASKEEVNQVYGHCTYVSIPSLFTLKISTSLQNTAAAQAEDPEWQVQLSFIQHMLTTRNPNAWVNLLRLARLTDRKHQLRLLLGKKAKPYLSQVAKACSPSHALARYLEIPPSQAEQQEMDKMDELQASADYQKMLQTEAKQTHELLLKRKQTTDKNQIQSMDALLSSHFLSRPWFLANYQVEGHFLKSIFVYKTAHPLIPSLLEKEPTVLVRLASAATTAEISHELSEAQKQIGQQFVKEMSELCRSGGKYGTLELTRHEADLYQVDQESGNETKQSLLSLLPEYLPLQKCLLQAAEKRGNEKSAKEEVFIGMAQICTTPILCGIPWLLGAQAEHEHAVNWANTCATLGGLCSKQDEKRIEHLEKAARNHALRGLTISGKEGLLVARLSQGKIDYGKWFSALFD